MSLARISSRGFTLFEILIALTVLSLVSLAAFKATGNAVNNILYLKERTLAHWVAMNKNAEMELAETWSKVDNRQGTEVMAGTEWPWRITGHQTPDPEFRRVEIAVWHGNREGEPITTLTTYLKDRKP
ncbi:MAG: type II secretion system minor pseudopilin GspI [Desulfobia sp.]